MKKLILLITMVSFTVQAQNLTVSSGKSWTVEKTGSVKIAGNLINNGTFTLNSDADEFSSVIVDYDNNGSGSSTGNIDYNRYVNAEGTDEWDLIGSPLDGVSIYTFVTNNTSGTATLATNGSAYAVGEYDNATDTWTNYTTATAGVDEAAGNFDIGKGYQMASVSGGTGLLKFTGTVASTTQTQAIINNDAANANAGRRWNLIANPFPSYVQGNTNADGTNNFLTVNADKLDDSFEAVYGYDADGTGYTVYNNVSSTLRLAPGQAFMVASDNTVSDNVSFTNAMRTVGGGDDLIVGDDIYDSQEVVIKLYNDNTVIEEARFYFEDGLTLGLNPGYDAGAFSQSAAIMSRLVEEDEGVGFVINAMGTESMNSTVIPLVINQEAYQDFRVVLFTHTIPDNVNVYLEDSQQGTMTLLNEQDFELTPESTLSEVGRFYLHLTEDTFSNEDEVETNLLNVFKADYNSFITVEGLAMQSGNTNVKLYGLLGREILSTELNNLTNTQIISTETIATGVYVIKLQSGNRVLTKKLIIK